MAEEKKERKIVSASDTTKTVKTATGEKKVQQAKPVGNAGGLRCGAIILWVLAICCEVFAFLFYFGKINITFAPTMAVIIGAIVLDLIFVVIGSLLWKKANLIDPASKKNKVKFWLWNNMGMIVAVFAFLPLIILIFTDKEKKFDKNTRIIAGIAAVVALLVALAVGHDWNPVSQEDLTTAQTEIDGNVYWTHYGHVYHLSENCQHLNNSDTLVTGTVEEAVAANKSRLCKTCLNNWNKEHPDDQISSEVVTDE
ncbi:MAG: hypothetical protein K6F16_04855 [Lachnospiraceae bacterium]|nr:YrzE family protein [Lachnospiraceae bacterium]MCR5428307.1 hypothetical protein [Lachnospiraceae bacterium]